MATDDRMNLEPSSVYKSEITTPQQLEFEPVYTSIDKVPPYSLLSGITMQSVAGNRIMMTWVTIEPNAVVPTHQHPHEQSGTVLEGIMTLTLGDKTYDVHPGDIYTIPPNLPHSAISKDGCRVLDIFSPAREDFLEYAVQ
jgi:quercetin dioxygenase-like cupin family protein